MDLIKYRDSELGQYLFYWIDSKNVIVSPNFPSKESAYEWIQSQNTPQVKVITDQ